MQKWVIDGYRSLIERGKSISEEEMSVIGSVAAFRLMHMREDRMVSFGLGERTFDIDATIRKVFQQEIASIATEEKNLRRDGE